MGQRQGQTADPYFDPNYFKAKSAEKHLKLYPAEWTLIV